MDGNLSPERCGWPRPRNGRLGDGMAGILGYARVSTSDQDVAGQTMRLTQAGAIKVFTDVRSGRTMDRPGLDELLVYATGGRHARRRASGPSRAFTRRVAGDCRACSKRAASLCVSLEEKIDTASAAGELVFHVFGAIAHFERRLIAERTKDGIAAARARGNGQAVSHSIRTRSPRPSNSCRQVCRQPPRPDNLGWAVPPCIARSVAPA